ncbi:MAG: hypothetical protein R6X20_01955 [Phycisphaerae bacterium]
MTEDDDRRGIDAEPRSLAVALASLLGHIVGMAGCAAAGVWLVAEALGAPGPAWSRVAFGAAGAVLAVGGLALGISGIRRFGRWGRSDGYGRRLEQRARELGLPTDPEAYQDGGLAVAARARNLEAAELTAIALRGAGIPAWVPDRATAGWYWHLQYAISPGGMRVMVPHGRLDDARQVLAERGHQEPESAESAERGDVSEAGPARQTEAPLPGKETAPPAEVPADEQPAPEDDPAERLLRWCRGLMVILFISITLTSPLVLPASVWVFAKAWDGFEKTGRHAFKRAMRWSAVTGIIALLMLAALASIFVPMVLEAMEPHRGPPPDQGYYLEREMPLP